QRLSEDLIGPHPALFALKLLCLFYTEFPSLSLSISLSLSLYLSLSSSLSLVLILSFSLSLSSVSLPLSPPLFSLFYLFFLSPPLLSPSLLCVSSQRADRQRAS